MVGQTLDLLLLLVRTEQSLLVNRYCLIQEKVSTRTERLYGKVGGKKVTDLL